MLASEAIVNPPNDANPEEKPCDTHADRRIREHRIEHSIHRLVPRYRYPDFACAQARHHARPKDPHGLGAARFHAKRRFAERARMTEPFAAAGIIPAFVAHREI